MFSPRSRVMVTPGLLGRAAIALALAVAVAACSSAGATPTAVPSASSQSATPSESPSASPTASDTPAATASPTTAPTDTPAPTPAPPTPAPPKPTSKPAVTPTSLPPLAIGLCTGAQLSLEITSWQGDTGTSYAHVTATNVSSAGCSMRGSSRALIIDGHGKAIGDAGSASAKVSTSDPVYTLAPNGQINTIVQWGNWCKAAPAQKVTVEMAMAFGLGSVKAPALGDAPIPTCYASSQATAVSSEAWLP
jgi:hypothetical protein